VNLVDNVHKVELSTPDTSVAAPPAPEPTPTPFVETDEMKAQTENAKKAAALRAQQETGQHAKNLKAAKEFKNGE
jgi:hypothetical protein